mmetsp:Transcript_17347/g.39763  ORF Transcript_17347/g.39763 Transcript_17347/m.39763 type:complete len:211 (-) Transcript_17347:763-1395(-)
MVFLPVRRVWPVGRLCHRVHHGVLHILLVPPGAGGVRLVPHRRRHQHHLRPRARIQVGHLPRHHPRRHRLRRAHARRHVRHLALRARHARHPRHLPHHRCVRPRLRQRGRHRRDVRAAPRRAPEDGRPRRGGQHDGGHRQGLRDRIRLTRGACALRRVRHAAQCLDRQTSDSRSVGSAHFLGSPPRLHATVLVLCDDDEVSWHGGQRHGH